MTNDAYPGARSDRVAAQRSREAAFARIGRVRGLTIVGAGALTAAIAGVVSAVAPGRTLGAKTVATVVTHHTARVSRRASSAALKMPPLASPSQLGLGGPGAPPQASSQPQQSSPAPTQTQTQTQPSAPAPQSSAPVQPAPGPVVSGGS